MSLSSHIHKVAGLKIPNGPVVHVRFSTMFLDAQREECPVIAFVGIVLEEAQG
jgi:hypothetical protein